jgi:hypothetical protein
VRSNPPTKTFHYYPSMQLLYIFTNPLPLHQPSQSVFSGAALFLFFVFLFFFFNTLKRKKQLTSLRTEIKQATNN